MSSKYTYGSPMTRVLRRWRFGVVKLWIPNKAKVLDLGCGIWARMEEEIEDYELYVGMDRNTFLKKETKQRQLLKHDLTRPWPRRLTKQKFDAVLVLALLEHLKNPGEVVQKAAAVLKPGGVVIITTPNERSPARRLHELSAKLKLLSQNAAEEHEKFLSKRDLCKLIKAAGLKVRHYQVFMGNLNQILVAEK